MPPKKRVFTLALYGALSQLISFAAAAHNSPPGTFIIEAWGGSSTRGVMAVREGDRLRNIVAEHNEIAVLNQLLQEKYGSGVRVINRGAPSAQAIELLNGRYKYAHNPPWQEAMQRSDASLILLNFATNDARHFHFHDIEEPYQVSPQRYSEVMKALIDSAQAKGKAVVLQEPHPLCGRAEKWDVAPYAARLEAIARAEKVPLVSQYQRIKKMPDWRAMMSPDCIHPSEQLYRIKALETFKVIEQHFGAQLAALHTRS
ncbi:SGNH/GDSL hydrolase family protein [Candidatus Pantoea deserta]|uniref:SGNH/GDSL hydrolase family protein n=1 Tax=Candidatus Pantoea deserta TaxID=1869313 RepID=A0A3N4NTW8_9GAMM|nr:SGNH/GDSL hydrolase family protein [Pantoea deserta]RPD99811.1 SGNH/GDSL hydrolase family protein [Pantoea deserta]